MVMSSVSRSEHAEGSVAKSIEQQTAKLPSDLLDQAAGLVVSDSGIGIHPDFLPHVFQPFRQGESNTTTGLGLGLGIVKNLVELHGGRVAAESAGVKTAPLSEIGSSNRALRPRGGCSRLADPADCATPRRVAHRRESACRGGHDSMGALLSGAIPLRPSGL